MQGQHFDLIAIGGGSGGLAVAEKAAQMGRNVALIEGNRLGGTCVNNGCVPKKIMWYAANLAHAVDDASAFGIPSTRGETDWTALVAARDLYIGNINKYWDGYVDDSGITRIQGYAKFTGPRSVEVEGRQYTADHLVIATGGQPIVPPLPGAELGITSDDFFTLNEQPGKVAVIGGGYIAVELAGVLGALGSEVSVVALEDRILERFDLTIGKVEHQEPTTANIACRRISYRQCKSCCYRGINGISSLAENLQAHLGGQHGTGRNGSAGTADRIGENLGAAQNNCQYAAMQYCFITKCCYGHRSGDFLKKSSVFE